MHEVGPIVEFSVKRLTAKPAVVKQKVNQREKTATFDEPHDDTMAIC